MRIQPINKQMFAGFRNIFAAGNGNVLYIFICRSMSILCSQHHHCARHTLVHLHCDQMASIIHFACWMVRWFPIIWKLQISQHFCTFYTMIALDRRLLLIASGEKPFLCRSVFFSHYIRCSVPMWFWCFVTNEFILLSLFFCRFYQRQTIQYYVIWYRCHATFIIIQFIHSGGALINDAHSPFTVLSHTR